MSGEVPGILRRRADNEQTAGGVRGPAQRTTEQSRAFDPSGAGEQVAHEANAFGVHLRLPRRRRDDRRRVVLSIVG